MSDDRAARHRNYETSRELALSKRRVEELEKALAPPPKRPKAPDIFHVVTNKNPTREQLADAVSSVNKGESALSVTEKTGIGYKKLKGAVERSLENKDIVATRGRQHIWTEEMTELLIRRIRERDLRNNSLLHTPHHHQETIGDFDERKPEEIPGTFPHLAYQVYLEVKEKSQGRPLRAHEKKMFGETVLREVEKTVGNVLKASSPTSVQNERRLEALEDAYNFVSLATQASVVFAEGYEGSLVFNMDTSSHLLNDYVIQRILVGKHILEELNKRHRNPTYTEDAEKKRGVSHTTVTSADGLFQLDLITLKDEKFNSRDPELVNIVGKTYNLNIFACYSLRAVSPNSIIPSFCFYRRHMGHVRRHRKKR